MSDKQAVTRLEISISKQKLYMYLGDKLLKRYPVSTSKYGAGNKADSNKTPLGLHRIVGRFGRNARSGAIFKRRRDTGKVVRAGAD